MPDQCIRLRRVAPPLQEPWHIGRKLDQDRVIAIRAIARGQPSEEGVRQVERRFAHRLVQTRDVIDLGLIDRLQRLCHRFDLGGILREMGIGRLPALFEDQPVGPQVAVFHRHAAHPLLMRHALRRLVIGKTVREIEDVGHATFADERAQIVGPACQRPAIHLRVLAAPEQPVAGTEIDLEHLVPPRGQRPAQIAEHPRRRPLQEQETARLRLSLIGAHWLFHFSCGYRIKAPAL